jgi:hypothetical protein
MRACSTSWRGRYAGTGIFAVLLELLSGDIVVGGLPCQAVPVLSEHYGYTAGGLEVAHLVHAGPLHSHPTLARVLHLLKYLEPLSGGVFSQSLKLLGEGVAAPCLLVCGDTGVEDGPLGAMAIGGGNVLAPFF